MSLEVIHKRIAGDCAIIHVIGSMEGDILDLEAPAIYNLIAQLPNNSTVIFDFSTLEYVNSKSAGYIADFYNKITEKDSDMIISGAQGAVYDILDLLGITQIMYFASDLEEAKKNALI